MNASKESLDECMYTDTPIHIVCSKVHVRSIWRGLEFHKMRASAPRHSGRLGARVRTAPSVYTMSGRSLSRARECMRSLVRVRARACAWEDAVHMRRRARGFLVGSAGSDLQCGA